LLAGRCLQDKRIRKEGISEGWAVPFVQGWCWVGSSREGCNLGHHDGGTGSGDGCNAMRLEGLDGEDDEETEGEEGQDGADDEQGLMMFGW
jgi:hypothetical protein